MEILTTLVSIATVCFSFVTPYDLALGTVEWPTRGARSLLRMLVSNYQRELGMLVPLLMWHIYRNEFAAASWDTCIILIIRKNWADLDEDLILAQIEAAGPVAFSTLHFLPTFATFLSCYLEIFLSAKSPLVGIVQVTIMLLPNMLSHLVGIKRFWKDTLAPILIRRHGRSQITHALPV